MYLLQRSQTLHRARRGLPTRVPGLPQLPKLPRGPCPLPQECALPTLALLSKRRGFSVVSYFPYQLHAYDL